MKKALLIAATAIACFCSESFSQSSINIGGNLSTGSKSFPENGKTGVGASIEYFKQIFPSGGARLYAGYDHFSHQISNPDSAILSGHHGKNLAFIPARIGYQQFLVKDKLFVYADAGIFLLNTPYKNLSKKSGFSYALGTGYMFDLTNTSFLQLSGIYSFNKLKRYPSDNYFTIRLAYGISFKQ